MGKLLLKPVLLLATFAAYTGHAAADECSTEKVNSDCTVTIDRSYPVTVPTIQMRPGKKVTVKIVHPLPFESLSLDLQTAQALAGTDQTAGFVTAALPYLKGSWLQTQTYLESMKSMKTAFDGGRELDSITKYKKHLEDLQVRMDRYIDNAATIYDQLNEVLGTIPPEVLPQGQRLSTSRVKPEVPRPWLNECYPKWRIWMVCELADQECPLLEEADKKCPLLKKKTSVDKLLAKGADLMNELGPCPKPPDSPSPKIIACQVTAIQTEVGKLPPGDQAKFAPYLQELGADGAVLSADLAAITAVNKDLSSYWDNIDRSTAITPPDPLGDIPDPYQENEKNSHLQKSLGRQVVFAVNAVNEVGTFTASVPAATAKKSVVTITVLYADPRFEVSAGAFFSTLPNRSFANQTTVTQNQGAPPTPGNVVITQTISRPTIVPFVGANWRMLPNFTWPDRRRGALYFTGAVGLNPNNTTMEFGVGPSLSWRSVMFSPMFHWGHDVRLTQGEYVGEVWCNMSGQVGSIPKCTGNPPSPSTEKYWKGAFALGVSIRIPSVFGGGGSSAR